MIKKDFWCGKKVFITGHTGFKGSWLCLWLHSLGAKITGYSLKPPTEPSLYDQLNIEKDIISINGDIRDKEKLQKALLESEAEIIFHLAAQPLVRDSYIDPAETYSVNVMGTVNLFEAVRKSMTVKAVINITSDKCYENKEWVWSYREDDKMGGYDPYSNSKACSELITTSYRLSFFNPKDYEIHGVGIASARAGNVIGGGDWAKDRLVPDCLRALLRGDIIRIRNPQAVRPWQHVLEPISGYLVLAQKLYEFGPPFAEGWNFGPNDQDTKSVEWVMKKICEKWDTPSLYEVCGDNHMHEANHLKLDCSKVNNFLGWYPKWNLENAISKVIEWTIDFRDNKDVREVCLRQIREYSEQLSIRDI